MMVANSRSVNVKRTDLLAKLKENRAQHAEDYRVAMEGYRVEVEKLLAESLEKFTNNQSAFDQGLYISEEPPQNHTKEYDLAIMMMEMSQDETIHMDSTSFNQYVMDNWAWKEMFTATTSKYITNVVGAKR